jgi:hypothetical protein
MAMPAFQAANFHPPPTASAIASSVRQLARRLLWKPGGDSGVDQGEADELNARSDGRDWRSRRSP